MVSSLIIHDFSKNTFLFLTSLFSCFDFLGQVSQIKRQKRKSKNAQMEASARAFLL